VDSLTNKSGDQAKGDHLRMVMVEFAKLLGAAPREARALATAIAKGPDRPVHERDAMAKIRRAVLVAGTEDDADRAILATWLSRNAGSVGIERLPGAGPGASGLPMPPQDLDGYVFSGFTGAVGPAARAPRAQPLRSDT